MSEKNYELIKFHVNWADELDIDSFFIKPYIISIKMDSGYSKYK